MRTAPILGGSPLGRNGNAFVSPRGELLTVSTALWGDGYNVSNQTPDRQNEYSGFSGRLFPQAGAQWRLPLLRQSQAVQQIVEPIEEIILGNPSCIPNEDSRDFELQDTNLFGFDCPVSIWSMKAHAPTTA